MKLRSLASQPSGSGDKTAPGDQVQTGHLVDRPRQQTGFDPGHLRSVGAVPTAVYRRGPRRCGVEVTATPGLGSDASVSTRRGLPGAGKMVQSQSSRCRGAPGLVDSPRGRTLGRRGRASIQRAETPSISSLFHAPGWSAVLTSCWSSAACRYLSGASIWSSLETPVRPEPWDLPATGSDVLDLVKRRAGESASTSAASSSRVLLGSLLAGFAAGGAAGAQYPCRNSPANSVLVLQVSPE